MSHSDKHEVIPGKPMRARSLPIGTHMELPFGDAPIWCFLLYEFLISIIGPLPRQRGLLLRWSSYVFGTHQAERRAVAQRDDSPRAGNFGWRLRHHRRLSPDRLRRRWLRRRVLRDEVIVNRGCARKVKTAQIRVGAPATIRQNVLIVSLARIDIGREGGTACYISAGGYHTRAIWVSVREQRSHPSGPIRIGDDVRIGTGPIILDGVTNGSPAVAGAGAVVATDLPERAIVAGLPVKINRQRH